jgi:HD-GYP domain-containing protein (c-di-GMP phosphodiesterase class II)
MRFAVLLCVMRAATITLVLIVLCPVSAWGQGSAVARELCALSSRGAAERLGEAIFIAKGHAGMTPEVTGLVRQLPMSTRIHSYQVGADTSALATKLELPAREISLYGLAAVGHDVGKVTFPKFVRENHGPPTEEMWPWIRGHSAYSELLFRLRFQTLGMEDEEDVQQFLEVVRSHHEDINGGGYPDGKAGDEIDLGAQLIRVVDTFNAMTDPERPWRNAREHREDHHSGMTSSEALDRMNQLAGETMSPGVLDAYIQVLADQGRLDDGASVVSTRSSTTSPAAPESPSTDR